MTTRPTDATALDYATPTPAPGPMPGRTLIVAGLLVAVGVGGFALSERHAPTSLIPAVAGLLLGACGGLALARPAWTKHAMHAAAALALLGLLASAGRLGSVLASGNVPDALAFSSQVAMATLCAAFVVMCVLWFVGNRKARRAAGA